MKLSQEIIINQNIIFTKPNCAFCHSTLKLAKNLVELDIIEAYKIYELGKDFEIEELEALLGEYIQNTTITFPQIFIKGQYIGTNNHFYSSNHNRGDENKMVDSIGGKIPAPRKINPMNF